MHKNSFHNKRKALGRGLSNLIPTAQSETEDGGDLIQDVEIGAIDANPYQPRIEFDEAEIAGLAESIRNQGLLQPIVLRQREHRYEIISGERRFRAFKYLNRGSIPCVVRTNITDKEMLELALVENIQREQLNEIEQALAYRKLIDEFNYTHEELAGQVGKSRTAVTNCLRLLNLPEEIRQMVGRNEISSGHARALLSLDTEEKQLEAARRIVEDKLTVRDVEQLAQQDKTPAAAEPLLEESAPCDGVERSGDGIGAPEKTKASERPLDPNVAAALERLQYRFGTSVKIKFTGDNKGRVEIDYFNEEDLVRIFDLLLDGAAVD